MSFVALHTSDLHIGKPFAGFDAERQALLRESRLGAIGRLAQAARTAGAADILVAGDTFDRQGLADDLVRQALARFAAHADVVWHVIPGNHDADVPGGIWERAIRLGLPPNVRLHRAAAPIEIRPGVWLLPAPLQARAAATDPTAWMDATPTPAGVLRIGLAHGSVQGFGSAGTAAVLIDPGRRRRAGLTALALGDWHGTKEVAPAVWYSGTPEPDQFADNDPGNALVLAIAGTDARISKVAVAERRWVAQALALDGPEGLAALTGVIDGLGVGAERALAEVRLSGQVSLAARTAIDTAIEQLRPRLFALRIRDDELATLPDRLDIAAIDDPRLGRAMARLTEMAAATTPEAAVATGALRLLHQIVASLERRP